MLLLSLVLMVLHFFGMIEYDSNDDLEYVVVWQSNAIGLDIQPEALYLVQLKRRKRHYFLRKAVMTALPSGIFSTDGRIVQWDLLQQTIEQLVIQYRLHGKKVAIALPVNLSHIQHIKLPSHLDDAAIEEAIERQIKHTMPGIQDELCVDFTIVDFCHDNTMDVFFIVTRKEYLLLYINCIAASGMEVSIVDIDLYALSRCVHMMLDSALSVIHDDEKISRTTVLPIVKNNDKYSDIILIIILYPNVKITLLVTEKNKKIDYYDSDLDNNTIEEFNNKLILSLSYIIKNNFIINKVIFCGNDDLFDKVKSVVSDYLELDILFVRPFAFFKYTDKFIFDFSPEKVNFFLIAIGLAMRTLLTWWT